MSEFVTFLWKGQTRYRCPQCSFDGPLPRAVIDHLRCHQVSNPSPAAPLFDYRGALLEPTESEAPPSESPQAVLRIPAEELHQLIALQTPPTKGRRRSKA